MTQEEDCVARAMFFVTGESVKPENQDKESIDSQESAEVYLTVIKYSLDLRFD
jgi:hypothetical protein